MSHPDLPIPMSMATTTSGHGTGIPDNGGSAPLRVLFTISEAAKACQCDRKTITRKLDQLEQHGATKDPRGVWQIPVETLQAVGLKPGRPTPAEDQPQVDAPSHHGTMAVAVEEWLDLKLRVERVAGERDREKERADGFERLAAEARKRAEFAEKRVLEIEAAPVIPPTVVDVRAPQHTGADYGRNWIGWKRRIPKA